MKDNDRLYSAPVLELVQVDLCDTIATSATIPPYNNEDFNWGEN